jgi:hypothetical protein
MDSCLYHVWHWLRTDYCHLQQIGLRTGIPIEGIDTSLQVASIDTLNGSRGLQHFLEEERRIASRFWISEVGQ